MQHAMHYHTVQLGTIVGPDKLRVCTNGIERYKHIAGYSAPACIVEGNNIGIVVVLQKLPVNFYNFIVVTEKISQRAKYAAMQSGNLSNPGLQTAPVNVGELHPVGNPLKFHSSLKTNYKDNEKLEIVEIFIFRPPEAQCGAPINFSA